ncbi:hypothetical protein BDV19DRAFT_74171 [Aspergillus venezuelensis]
MKSLLLSALLCIRKESLGCGCRNKKVHAESSRRMLFDIEGNEAHGGLPLICSLVHMSSHADCIRGIDLTMCDPRAPFVYATTDWIRTGSRVVDDRDNYCMAWQIVGGLGYCSYVV